MKFAVTYRQIETLRDNNCWPHDDEEGRQSFCAYSCADGEMVEVDAETAARVIAGCTEGDDADLVAMDAGGPVSDGLLTRLAQAVAIIVDENNRKF